LLPEESDDCWTLEMERVLIERFQWSLYDLDRTDIESLFPFFFHLSAAASKKDAPVKQYAYADQVPWM
jgi:hypothetical protein